MSRSSSYGRLHFPAFLHCFDGASPDCSNNVQAAVAVCLMIRKIPCWRRDEGRIPIGVGKPHTNALFSLVQLATRWKKFFGITVREFLFSLVKRFDGRYLRTVYVLFAFILLLFLTPDSDLPMGKNQD